MLSRRPLLLVLGVAVLSQQAHANQILVKAPSDGGSYYGMYCDTCIAASFSLSSRYYVSTIDLVLRTPTATRFTTFDFSLQSALSGSITTYASEAITVPVGVVSTDLFTIDKRLRAGTYYLVGNVQRARLFRNLCDAG